MILVVIIWIPWALAHALWYGRNLCSTLPWSCHLGILDKMMENWDIGSIKWRLYSKVTGKLIRSWTPSLCEPPQLICDKKHFSPSGNPSFQLWRLEPFTKKTVPRGTRNCEKIESFSPQPSTASPLYQSPLSHFRIFDFWYPCLDRNLNLKLELDYLFPPSLSRYHLVKHLGIKYSLILCM